MRSVFTQPLLFVTRTEGELDSDRNQLYTDSGVVVYGAFAPGSSSEVTAGGDQVTTQPTAFAPYGTDVSAIDAVVNNPVLDPNSIPILDEDGKYQGDWYEVDGDPASWSNPYTGRNPGVSIPLKRVTG